MADRFDKFTDRARRALQRAQVECVRLGHGQIAADHLVLGLLDDRSSVAVHVLAGLDLDLTKLAARAAAHQPSVHALQPQVGLGASAKQTIELAVEEARGLDHHYVGTEHLLLGLLRQGSNPVADECRARGITVQAARGAIVAILNASPAPGPVPVQRVTTVPPPPEAVDVLLAGLERFLADPTSRSTEADAGLIGKLSDSAFDVLGFAAEEARRFNHAYVGTEHLLLGLVREPETSVGRLLAEMGAQFSQIRNAVEFIVGRGDRPEVVELRYTPRARKVILLAIDEAQRLGDPAAGAEHLLLGVLREGEGIAVGVLESLGIGADRIRARVLEALGAPAPEVTGPLPTQRLNRLARKALLQAQLAARWYYHPQVGTEHLLLGVVRERDGAAARALHDLGADLSRVLEHFEALTSEPSGRATPERVEYTPAALAALERAGQEAAQRGQRSAGTGHLLLGILSVPGGQAHELLKRLGVSADRARETVEPLLSDELG